jgi:hypothetical protein
MTNTLAKVAGIIVLALAVLSLVPETKEPTPLITVGPTETALLPPRVQVLNGQTETIVVSYVVDGSTRAQELGTVPALARETFELPLEPCSIKLFVTTRLGDNEFVTSTIEVGSNSDIELAVTRELGRSIVTVGELDLARALATAGR